MPYRLPWTIAAVLAAAAVTACSDDQAPADSRARAYFQRDSLITLESVFVTLKDGSTVWDFKPENFRRGDSDTTLFWSPDVQTMSAGNLSVELAVFTAGGQTISEGTLSLPLSPNWRWKLGIIHAVTDPSVGCDDCIGSSKFDIQIPGYDNQWIYVLWRGNGP